MRPWTAKKKSLRPGPRAAACIVTLASLLILSGADALDWPRQPAMDRASLDRHLTTISGYVEQLPVAEVGIWTVSGSSVLVTKTTRLSEEHGKAMAGAYVTVSGEPVGRTLNAYYIEVVHSLIHN